MNKRRKFLFIFGAALSGWSVNVPAQQVKSMPTVGVLSLEDDSRIALLREELRKLGYVDGRNIRLETRKMGAGYARLKEVADEYVGLKVDVIFSAGATATTVASQATSTIPIVMVAGIDPIREKLAKSMARPGRNVTGILTINEELTPKRMELARELMPGLKRLGLLWNPDSRVSAASLANTREAARPLNLHLEVVEARTSGDFNKAFGMLAKSGITIFVSMHSGAFFIDREQLFSAAAKHRLAGIFPGSDWVNKAALITYGADANATFGYAATYIKKILKGAKASDLPIEQPTKYELTVNLSAAKTLGIKIPQSILVRADRVIE